MKMLTAPVPSDDSVAEVMSAAMSHMRSNAAAECRTGMDTRAITDETMCASRRVQVPLETRGKSRPLKKQAGLYSAFLSALYICTLSFLCSRISSRTRSSKTVLMNSWAMAGLDEMKILVPA